MKHRDSPEYRRLLDIERAKVAKAEARYECRRCAKGLEPDYGLSDAANRFRAWLWRSAHRLNCPEMTVSPPSAGS